MTEELKQAAQAALEQLEFLNACYPHKTATDASDALRRALTQRPAAQTDREAFENAALAKWGPLDFERSPHVPEMYYNQRLDDAWIGFGFAVAWLRASLPAPQQATPEPLIVKGAMTGMVDAQVRDLWPTKKEQATPEPVGEVVAYREKLTGRLCEPEHTHRRKFPMCYEPLTRPAPGVPEGWRNVIAGTLKTDPWDSARVADYNSGWNDCQRKTLRWLERLAAAQANGGQ